VNKKDTLEAVNNVLKKALAGEYDVHEFLAETLQALQMSVDYMIEDREPANNLTDEYIESLEADYLRAKKEEHERW